MSPILQPWSTATLIFAAMMLISAWLTDDGLPAAYSTVALVAIASACLLLVMHRWWHRVVVVRLKPLVRTFSVYNGFRAPISQNDDISRLGARVSSRRQNREDCPKLSLELAAASVCRELSGNMRLAADHLESIKTLLEVSQNHQQPIPRAAFQNLELVSRNLREIERQFAANEQDKQMDSVLQFR
jgi:hypothetical protein